VSSW